MTPLVSIHIIAYQQQAVIEATLDSALAQRFPSFEIVVADDGSTDDTPRIIEAVARRHPGKVVALTGGPNLGITGNSNRALAACRGALIAFQGGDDLLLPDKLAAQAEWFAADASRVLCGHDCWDFDSATGENIGRHFDLARWRGGSGPEAFIANGCPYAATAVMVRRAAIPTYGFDERLRIVSDWKLWIDVLSGGGRWGHVDGVHARYRRHAGNITTTAAERCWLESFLTLAIVEAEDPGRAMACRRGRARLHKREGVARLEAGDTARARTHLLEAFLAAPERGLKPLAWYARSFAGA